MTPEDRELRAGCTEFLTNNGPVRPAEQLAQIDADVEPDHYGEGGVVAELEADVAARLGKPTAVFLPSGTMTQAATLRVYADRAGRRTIVWHPTSHLALHEMDGYARVHNLHARPAGEADRLLTVTDLDAVAERPAALLLELPQREIGGQQPAWDDLLAQTEWARSRGIAVHLDGARLWESAVGYGRTPADVAALFDTVYVSFYKGIGALPGCALAGPADVVAEVREWRHRLGGRLFGLWPGAASALAALPGALAEMPARLAHARAIADRLRELDGVRLVPDAPQVSMMHVLLDVAPDRFAANARRIAAQRRVWVVPQTTPTGDPGVTRFELGVGRATMRLSPEDVAGIVAGLRGERSAGVTRRR